MPVSEETRPATRAYLRRLLRHCLDMQSVWSVGHGAANDAPQARPLALLVFADRATLERLRKCDDLRRPEVDLFVVVDGDRFENVWGEQRLSGSLVRWAWREIAAGQAYYDESRWLEGEAGCVVRVRCTAYRLWTRAEELQAIR